MKSLNINEFSSNIYSLINRISASGKPTKIVGGVKNVVIISEEGWNNISKPASQNTDKSVDAADKESLQVNYISAEEIKRLYDMRAPLFEELSRRLA